MEAPHVGLYVTVHAVVFPFNLNSDFFPPHEVQLCMHEPTTGGGKGM